MGAFFEHHARDLYAQRFDRLKATTSTGQELYEEMLKLYPNRVNPGWALWNSAHAAKS